jgi:hypothetical protein
MNILLWVLQVSLALLCISGGVFQIFKLDELKQGVAAMRSLPRALWAVLGAFGCLTGLGLVVPGATNLLPGLTPIAAAAVAAQSALITAFYLRYRDRAPLPYSVVMLVMAIFICYGRLELHPF